MQNILKKIKPTKEQEKKVQELTNSIIKKIKINNAVAELGGSGAKGTWLKDTYDIDIYVKFNYNKYKNKDISSILKKELKKHFKIITLHGSRDYFQIKKNKYTFEIIPILNINNIKQAKNITDISPFHVKYVKKFNKPDEIRLVKAFCKAQGCYGAESYIKGFSGYVLEILTIYYKSFKNLIKNVTKWKSKTFIGDKLIINKLNKAKKQSPLILIDPVDSSRNAAAALSQEQYNKFIKAAKAYLKNPSEKFFEKKEFDIKELKNKYKNKLVLLKISPKKGKKDVIGAKLLKCLNYINKNLTNEGFKIQKYSWHYNKKIYFYFIINKKNLPKTKIHYGPPIKYKERLNNFKNKWNDYKIYKKNNLVYIKLKRKYTKIKDYLNNLIKKDPLLKKTIKYVKFIYY